MQPGLLYWLASRKSGSLSKVRDDLGVPSPSVLLPVQLLLLSGHLKPSRKWKVSFI